MDWEHKGMVFTIETETLGPFVLASARVPNEGFFVRVRPFSVLLQGEAAAVEHLKEQIRMEFRRLPEPVSTES